MSISQDIIFRLENSKLYTQRGFPQDVNRGGRFLADLQATKQTNGYKETSKLPQRQFADHPPTQDTRAVNVILQNALGCLFSKLIFDIDGLFLGKDLC